MKPGDLVEIEIDSLAYGGTGVGRTAGVVIFVPQAAPGDLVLVEITEAKNRFLRGGIREIRRPSPERTEPRCDSYGRCGGCQYQHIRYDRQLYWKQEQVKDLCRRIGGIAHPPLVDIVASSESYHYRGKVEIHAAREIDGRLRMGFHQGESNLLVEVERCEIAHQSVNETLQRLRWELSTGKIASLPRKFAIWSGLDGEGEVGTSLRATVERPVKDRSLSVPATGFFQANLHLTDRLVDLVVELCSLDGSETVVDCYCGSGLFSFFLAPQARRLYGIESDAAALARARFNLERAGCRNAVFFAGDVGRALQERFVRGGIGVDVLILDPPRPGLTKEVMTGIFSLRPQRIVYISCNPATLARDVKHLTAGSYHLHSLHPLDMFPQTGHVETVALMKLLW